MSWDSITKEFNVVIDIPNTKCKSLQDFIDLMNYLFNEFDKIGVMYFSILHDRDTKQDGTPKAFHYHIVLLSPKRRRCSTMVYMISRMCNDIPLECIQITTVESLPLCVQYLTHKNTLTKYQYSFSDIFTNNREQLMILYNAEESVVKVDEYVLFSLVDKGYTESEILFKIGLGNFNAYKSVIKMLLSEYQYKWKWERLKLLYSDGVVNDETN